MVGVDAIPGGSLGPLRRRKQDLRTNAGSRFHLSPTAQAAKLNSRIPSKIRRNAGSGVRHMVRYVSRKGSQPARSPLGFFRVCENRRHSRGLGWRALVSGWRILEFRLWTGGFAAAVSAHHFPISVSAYPRPVRYVTETGRRRRSWPAEPRIAYHARRRHEICGFEILLTVRGSECEPNQRAFNETLRVPLALSGHC